MESVMNYGTTHQELYEVLGCKKASVSTLFEKMQNMDPKFEFLEVDVEFWEYLGTTHANKVNDHADHWILILDLRLLN